MTCKYCDRKVPLAWLDEHGVRPSVSGLPATSLSHHVDDYWWPCERWPCDLRSPADTTIQTRDGNYCPTCYYHPCDQCSHCQTTAPAPTDTVTVTRECLERALKLAHESGRWCQLVDGEAFLGADEMREARRLAGLED